MCGDVVTVVILRMSGITMAMLHASNVTVATLRASGVTVVHVAARVGPFHGDIAGGIARVRQMPVVMFRPLIHFVFACTAFVYRRCITAACL